MQDLAPNISNPQSTRVFRVGAVQMIFAESMAANLGKIERAATAAARKGADAVLFPECATTGYAMDFGSLKPSAVDQALNAISQLAADLRVQLLVGSPIFRSGRLYNALLVFNRSGRLVHAYSKCQLTPADRQWFSAGEDISLFELDGIPASTFICHERRYPELPRISAMAGARILFHPNAGMDSLAVSRKKRGGRDGMSVRAFENAVYYVFANSVGPQGLGKWSAGDSKIVHPSGKVLRIANNQDEATLIADLKMADATGKYALESLEHPRWLAAHWRSLLPKLLRKARRTDALFEKRFPGRPA
jgi:predicted amidohydrolase